MTFEKLLRGQAKPLLEAAWRNEASATQRGARARARAREGASTATWRGR